MDLSSVTLQQLRYLVALDRHRSFREAALASHVSQPALSMQLKKLEEVLGLSVFDRARQPIVPTARGESIIAQARLVLSQFERIGSVAGKRELAGGYRLAVIPTLAATFVPLLVPPFARAYPRVELEVVEMQTPVLLRGLRDGTIDGAIAATPLDVPGIDERTLCSERLLAYLPPRHELLSRARVRQADLMEEHVWLLGEGHCFRTQVLHLCGADRRRRANVAFEGSSFDALIGLVDAGYGVTVLPELAAQGLPPHKAERLRAFAAPEPVRNVGIIAGRKEVRGDVADALFEVLHRVLPAAVRSRRGRSQLLHPTRSPRR